MAGRGRHIVWATCVAFFSLPRRGCVYWAMGVCVRRVWNPVDADICSDSGKPRAGVGPDVRGDIGV
eukprot:723608-Pyramimonas_sp.AAC.1